MKKETFSAFDAADYLKTEEDIAAYLQAATEDEDPQVLFAAMGDVVRARNVSKVAREAGLTREGVYKALSPEGNPSFATFWKVANALNIRLAFCSKAEAVEGARAAAKSIASGEMVVATQRRAGCKTIDVDDAESLRYWTKALGVSSARLKSAIREAHKTGQREKPRSGERRGR